MIRLGHFHGILIINNVGNGRTIPYKKTNHYQV
ncbi:hypothetical protein C7959_101114 [Orenia marismortui]|uniref:Uncharacterized protein n=1 Tax=Orenia marismortui TaxID=46469 RepID=A0A4R8HRK3_9FIRM|nr:hypothetical protein C7959_101114 [Orenia marismortui]